MNTRKTADSVSLWPDRGCSESAEAPTPEAALSIPAAGGVWPRLLRARFSRGAVNSGTTFLKSNFSSHLFTAQTCMGHGDLTEGTQDRRAACSLPAYKFWWGESQKREPLSRCLQREWSLTGREVRDGRGGEEGVLLQKVTGEGLSNVCAETRGLQTTSAEGTAGPEAARQEKTSEGPICWHKRPACRASETTVRVLFCAHLAGQVHIWKVAGVSTLQSCGTELGHPFPVQSCGMCHPPKCLSWGPLNLGAI